MVRAVGEHYKNGKWEDVIVFNNESNVITDQFILAEYHCDYERSLKAVGNNPYFQSKFLNGEL